MGGTGWELCVGEQVGERGLLPALPDLLGSSGKTFLFLGLSFPHLSQSGHTAAP